MEMLARLMPGRKDDTTNTGTMSQRKNPKRAARGKHKFGPPEQADIFQRDYKSNDIALPDKFLRKRPTDAAPLTVEKLDFAALGLPHLSDAYAVVLDNVLAPWECKQLLDLVEQSAVPDSEGKKWLEALVRLGGNYEVRDTEYRNSDRIIWDNPDLAGRIVERCFDAPGLREHLARMEGNQSAQGPNAVAKGQKWTFAGPNERLRFLRYQKGQFFRRHCDSAFEKTEGNKMFRSFYTLHLYLSQTDTVQGGATAFFRDYDGDPVYEVDARPGRVLIFQHRGLCHSGEEVSEGEKFTMRTDLMYEYVP